MALAALPACAGGPPLPKWPVSSPAELCDDSSLGPHDLCVPATRIEGWLKSDELVITDAARSPSGLTAPYKVRLRAPDGRTFSAKFKRAPDSLDAFNNSPRREAAAYELQKLFLEPDEYVVPPTVITCLPVAKVKKTMPGLEPHPGVDCAVGVLAYWVEGLSDEHVLDEGDFNRNPAYRDNLGKLNTLTVLIGHQDSIGDNVYRAKAPDQPRLFSVDNGLAFGAMGDNPIRFFSSAWSNVRVNVLPAKLVDRLKKLDPASFERLRVVAQLEKRGRAYVSVPPSAPLPGYEGVQRRGGTVQLGLTPEEITNVNLRLVKLLGEIGAGSLRVGGAVRNRSESSSSRPTQTTQSAQPP